MTYVCAKLTLLRYYADPRDDQIAELERHLAIVSQQLASMKSSKKRKAERQMSRTSSSKMNKSLSGSRDKSSKFGRTSKSGEKRKRPAKSKSEEDLLPEFTFEQKKDLSENINNLNGDQLNTVVQIIQSSMPNLDGVSYQPSPAVMVQLLYSFCFQFNSKDKRKLNWTLTLWIEEHCIDCMSLLPVTALSSLHSERSKPQKSRVCSTRKRMLIAKFLS